MNLRLRTVIGKVYFSQEEVHEVTSALSIYAQSIKVTEVLKDGDALTFLIVSQKVRKRLITCYWRQMNKKLSKNKYIIVTTHFLTGCLFCVRQLSGTGEYHVDRTYDDLEWLQQHLFSQENVPGIQGVIVSTASLSVLFHLVCASDLHVWQL